MVDLIKPGLMESVVTTGLREGQEDSKYVGESLPNQKDNSQQEQHKDENGQKIHKLDQQIQDG